MRVQLHLIALFCALAGMLASAPPVRANPSGSWGEWESARELYDAGKYRESLTEMKRQPGTGPAYYYNLGTIHFRLGEYGKAVAYFQKARRGKPHDPDILSNLELAQTRMAQKLGTQELDPASTAFERIGNVVPLSEAQAVIGLLALVTMFFLFRSYRGTRNLKATLSRPSGWLGAAALVLAAIIYQARLVSLGRPAAVAIEETRIFSGPSPSFQELTRLPPGIQVRMLGPETKSGDERWVQVRFSPTAIGWTSEKTLLRL